MMIKKISLILFSFLILNLNAQDEYEEPTIKIESEEPLYESKDSISVKNIEDKSVENNDKKPNKGENGGMSEFRKNFRIGGGFGITSYFDNSVNSQLFYFSIAPQFTYVINDYFEGGVSTSYQYIGSFGDLNSHSYSIGPILRAYPFEMIFLQVEGIFFRNHQSIDRGNQVIRVTDNNINAYVGGGLMQRFGPRSYVLTGIQVNLLQNSYTNNQTIPSIITSIHFGI